MVPSAVAGLGQRARGLYGESPKKIEGWRLEAAGLALEAQREAGLVRASVHVCPAEGWQMGCGPSVAEGCWPIERNKIRPRALLFFAAQGWCSAPNTGFPLFPFFFFQFP